MCQLSQTIVSVATDYRDNWHRLSWQLPHILRRRKVHDNHVAKGKIQGMAKPNEADGTAAKGMREKLFCSENPKRLAFICWIGKQCVSLQNHYKIENNSIKLICSLVFTPYIIASQNRGGWGTLFFVSARQAGWRAAEFEENKRSTEQWGHSRVRVASGFGQWRRGWGCIANLILL